MSDPTERGFEEVTRLADARDRLRAAVQPHGRTDRLPLSAAEGRTLAEPIEARRDVPGYDRAAMDGYFEPGHCLRPSDLGSLKAVGVGEVQAYQRPTVGVVPTGEELVQRDPGPGEVIETNGLTVSRYVERWGGKATYRNVVSDEYETIRAAVERDLTKDVVVTTGGSSVGERDLVPDVVDDLGEVLVHGIALKPGHPVAFGVVHETPVIVLPGYPVACIVNAVQFLRPAIKWVGGMDLVDHPTVEARLSRKLSSEPGVQTFARVKLVVGNEGVAYGEVDGEGVVDGDGDGERVAVPTRIEGAGTLSSVSLADGWVVVPEESGGIPAGETVSVENWEYYP